MNFEIILVKAGDLTSDQQAGLTKLNEECFGDVPAKEITDNFIAEPFTYLFAYTVACLNVSPSLFKRKI